MASIKISELNEYTEVQDNDLFPVVDVANGETKKVKATNIGTGGKELIMVGDESVATKNTKLLIETDTLETLGTEVVDTLDGNETTKAPSVRAVKEDLNTYSTEEKVIGKWIDGKPLYRKTIEGIVSKINENVIIGTIPNIETVAKKYGQGLAGGLYWTDLDLKYSDTISSIIQIGKADKQIIAAFSQTFLNNPFYLTIEYTKTTDSATKTINEEPISEEATI